MAEAKLKLLHIEGQILEDTLKNSDLTERTLQIIDDADLENNPVDSEIASNLFKFATKVKNASDEARKHVIRCILDKKIADPQLTAAESYFKKLKNKPFDKDDFDKSTGVGIFYTDEEVENTINGILDDNMEELLVKRRKIQGMIMGKIRSAIPFANSGVVFKTLTRRLQEILGDKTESIQRKKPREKRAKIEDRLNNSENLQLQESITFPDPKDNTQKTPEILEKHLAVTGGRVFTRFPPEPNGFLHIGHAKAMSLNFGYAKKMGGHCYMRFDDTNPEAESQEYIDSILDSLNWFGYEYYKITRASDYFDELYEFAIELIKRGKAYVCHQTAEEVKACRETHTESPWRNRSVEENLIEFEKMKNGEYAEGAAVLRMKMDMKSDNPCMWDHVAYRVKFVPHHNPKVGDKWCIYPTYDFTHAINDSLENITHSLCTLEFEMRRESYNWLLDALDLYKPVVWEFGRLKLTHTMMSKRKLIELVKGDFGIRGWDDPRLPTVNGMRRKGYTPESIKNFAEDIGVTRKPNVIVDYEKLEQFVREHLNVIALRMFAVLDPIKLTISNWEEGKVTDVIFPNIPNKPEAGERKSKFTGVVYIEKSDFQMDDSHGYFGLALNSSKPKWVRLKYANVIVRLVEVKNDDSGNPIELVCEYDKEGLIKKPKGNIHWIAKPLDGEPKKCEVRQYSHLFKSPEPNKVENWRKDIDPNSERVITAYVDDYAYELKPLDKVQFERHGYYCVDQDSTPDLIVFNSTVSLKESKEKKKLKSGK